MALRKPLVLGSDGIPQQLQSGDTLDAAISSPTVLSLTNGEGATTLTRGMPVYSSAANTVKRAQANAAATARIVGLCYDATIAAGATGGICLEGVMSASTAEWDAITGAVGGLTFNALYFLDPATVGKLTTTVPTTVGQLNVLVGIGLSTTVMQLYLDAPILL